MNGQAGRFAAMALRLAWMTSPVLCAQATLQITSPADGTVVRPGQSVSVVVAASPGGSFQQVALIGERELGLTGPLTSEPYQFTLQVPANIVLGRFRITASGATSPGQGVYSPSIALDVERADSPTGISVSPANLPHLRPGDRIGLRVLGAYSDGTKLDLTESTQTTYVSQNAGIVTVNAAGVVTAAGPGATQILVNSTVAVPVTVDPPVSLTPTQATMKASQRREFVARLTDPSATVT